MGSSNMETLDLCLVIKHDESSLHFVQILALAENPHAWVHGIYFSPIFHVGLEKCPIW